MSYYNNNSKTSVGVILGLLLGLIGLIIGLCIYPTDSYERSSFLKGWAIAFVISIILSVIFYFVGYSYLLAILETYPYYY